MRRLVPAQRHRRAVCPARPAIFDAFIESPGQKGRRARRPDIAWSRVSGREARATGCGVRLGTLRGHEDQLYEQEREHVALTRKLFGLIVATAVAMTTFAAEPPAASADSDLPFPLPGAC